MCVDQRHMTSAPVLNSTCESGIAQRHCLCNEAAQHRVGKSVPESPVGSQEVSYHS